MSNQYLLLAQNLIKNNKNLPNAPWVGPAINAIMNGDEKAGEEIANNLCNTYGMSREDAARQGLQMITDKIHF